MPAPPKIDHPLVDPNSVVFVSPARWDYHPPLPSNAFAAVKVPDGSCVFTSDGGQRWTAASSKIMGGRVICAGKAEASAAVASEDLQSAIRRADGSWVFAGDGGTLYEAADPLGPFSRTVPAPEPLAKVAGSGSAVVAATLEGKLLRWESASGWRPVAAAPALAGARIFDLAVADSGRALALAFPEALFASEDGGATWKPAGAPLVGARRIGQTGDGDLGVQGVFESIVWKGAAFARGGEHVMVPQATLEVEVGRAPSAGSVQAGRAVLDGDRYYEVIRPDNEGEIWQLARGRIEGRLESIPVPRSERCSNLRVGARGRGVFIACVFMDGGDIAADLSRSTDGGSTWGEPLRLVTPDTDQLNIVVAPSGSAMVTGACRSSDGGGSCKPSAPILIREAAAIADAGHDGGHPQTPGAPDASAKDAGADAGGGSAGPTLSAVPASAPQLSGNALSPVFSPDGRSAYFLGRRGKDDRIGLFVSHDGGETFSPRTLQSSALPHPRPRNPDEEEPSEPDLPESFDVDESSTVRPAEDGTLGMMVQRSRGGYAYVTTDDDGRVLQVAGPPSDDDNNPLDVIIAGYGRRVLAIPSYLPDTGPGNVWESLDGGANWDRQSIPQALVREYSRGNVLVSCSLAGCLIGDTVTRVGWGSAGEGGGLERPADPPPDPRQAVLTPIVCDLSATSKWSRVDDVYAIHGNPFPVAREIMRGKSVWSALVMDHATGALSVVTATLPESGEGEARVVRHPLAGPRGANTAIALSPTQVEGYAVIRAPFTPEPKGIAKAGAPLRNLEIAWENLLEGTTGHARVPDAGVVGREDIDRGDGSGPVLHTSMISITSHGLFVRPHHGQTREGDEIFVDPTGRVERYPSTRWPAKSALGSLDLHAEAVAIGGELLGVGLVEDSERDWGTLLLAKRGSGGTWSFNAESVVPTRAQGSPLLAITTWGWSAKSPAGVQAVLADPQHARAWAHFIGFRGDGTFAPPEPVPTLLDLGDRPRGCAVADRRGTPRTVMQLTVTSNRTVVYPGARHPVLVFEPRPKNAVGVAEPTTLLTSNAVLHGTPASPCVAAFQADSVSNLPYGAVIPGDLTRAWLFRSTDTPARPGKNAAGVSLEYRPMSCRYDPAARIPEQVWSQPGMQRP